ncbi:hypothetical protein COLO4_38593 [Corchorus olitorius]|uniref:Uncharacterized protein n=1 Tax=Corchorus olitorius TaxID=93759 RepID=A0A1R3FU00_9ROSI|nr:hypothetical protein COLO4_38593 [Corchorus olitorius]
MSFTNSLLGFFCLENTVLLLHHTTKILFKVPWVLNPTYM